MSPHIAAALAAVAAAIITGVLTLLTTVLGRSASPYDQVVKRVTELEKADADKSEELRKLRRAIDDADSANHDLVAANERLHRDNTALRGDLEALRADNRALRQDHKVLVDHLVLTTEWLLEGKPEPDPQLEGVLLDFLPPHLRRRLDSTKKEKP